MLQGEQDTGLPTFIVDIVEASHHPAQRGDRLVLSRLEIPHASQTSMAHVVIQHDAPAQARPVDQALWRATTPRETSNPSRENGQAEAGRLAGAASRARRLGGSGRCC
jgi:hypothetical protein